MKRNLIALTIAGALALPFTAAAIETEMHIYGSFLPFGENVAAYSPTATPPTNGASQVPNGTYTSASLVNRFRIQSNTSNLGFKGFMEVNEYLKVIWQVESPVSFDGDPPNTFAGRNTGVGLGGTWGTLFYGFWDTPYKYPLTLIGPIRGAEPFDNGMIANPGFNVPPTTSATGRVNGKGDAAFHRRQGNSVQYWTPNISGFSARLAWSINEGQTSTNPQISPQIFTGLLTFESGPFGARVAAERHNDYFGMSQLGGSGGATPTNRESWDNGIYGLAWIGWLPSGTKLTGVYEDLSYNTADTAANAIKHYDRTAWWAILQQKFGDHQIFGGYGMAMEGNCSRVGGGACTTTGLGSKQFSFGYVYSLNKYADVYAGYYQVSTDQSASYGTQPLVAAVIPPGADTRGFGIGIYYTFDASWKFTL